MILITGSCYRSRAGRKNSRIVHKLPVPLFRKKRGQWKKNLRNFAKKTASKRHRWHIAANLFFVFLLIGHLVSFTNNLRKVNTETQIHEFLVSTDGAKRKVRDYMETSSRTLRDWKKLIGLNDWTAEEIPRKLDDLISSADITAQVLLTDTLRGYSSAAPAGKPGEYGMEYSNTYFSIFQTLTRFRESGRPDDVIITSSFTNPINAETSIAFVPRSKPGTKAGRRPAPFCSMWSPCGPCRRGGRPFPKRKTPR